GATLPPARIVVVLRYFLEAELLVIIRTDPFAGVDRSFFQRRIDVPSCDLLRHNAEPLQDEAGKPAHTEFEALEIVERVDLPAEPASHLRPGAAERNANEVVFLVEVGQHLAAASVIEPSIELALIHAERKPCLEHESRVLAEEIVGGRLPRLDGAVLDRVGDL